jgi:hypothetical protein
MVGERLIGGVFALESAGEKSTPPPFLKHPAMWLANGRSALAVLAQSLRPDQAWLPSYLCDAVLGGLRSVGVSLKFYDVGDELRPRQGPWLGDIHEGDLFLLVDYFGFRADQTAASEARRRGAYVVEDACQALLTEGLGAGSDFVVLSPRKFVGVTDGGILLQSGETPLPTAPLAPLPTTWHEAALRAARGRRDFDRGYGQDDWFAAFQLAERSAPTGAYEASALTRNLLTTSVDYVAVCQARRRNFQILAGRLGEAALFPELPGEVVPLGFPMRAVARDDLRHRLFQAKVFPPVHWPIAGVVPDSFSDSHRLSATMLTLPCDQRYQPEDMNRVADLVLASSG